MNQSSYVSNRLPYYYGIVLSDYQQRVDRIVSDAAVRMRDSVLPKEELFFSLLEFLSQERRRLASDQKTFEEVRFGLRRDSPIALKSEGALFVTYLMDPYRDYGIKLLRELSHLPSEGSFRNEKCSFSWERVSYQALKKRGWTSDAKEEVNRSYRDYYFARELKEKKGLFERFLTVYQQNKLATFLKEGHDHDFFLATLFYEDIPQSGYFVPLEMGVWQIPIVLHHDFFRIQPSLKEISTLFATCLESKGSIDLFREQMALLSYRMSHVMPFCRGSAAIREWLEKAMYELRGFRVVYNHHRAIDLEALTALAFTEFIKSYNESLMLYS